MRLASVGSFPSGIGITPVEKRPKKFNYKKMGDANAKNFYVPQPVIKSKWKSPHMTSVAFQKTKPKKQPMTSLLNAKHRYPYLNNEQFVKEVEMEEELLRQSMLDNKGAGLLALIDQGVREIGVTNDTQGKTAEPGTNPEVSFTFKSGMLGDEEMTSGQ